MPENSDIMEKCENQCLKVLEFCENTALKLLEKCDITFFHNIFQNNKEKSYSIYRSKITC